jgi:hypothetical protein
VLTFIVSGPALGRAVARDDAIDASFGSAGAFAIAAALKLNTTVTEIDIQGGRFRDWRMVLHAVYIVPRTGVADTCQTHYGQTGPQGSVSIHYVYVCFAVLTWHVASYAGNEIGGDGGSHVADTLRLNFILRGVRAPPGVDLNELAAHYRGPHVRAIVRTRVMCQAGRAHSVDGAHWDIAPWVCERAPLWVVVHVCALLRDVPLDADTVLD